MYSKLKNRSLRKVIIVAIWLILWQIISLCVDNSILLVGPVETLLVLLGKVAEISFWKTVAMSVLRIVAGFLAGWAIGLLLAALSGRFGWAEDFFKPVISLMKTAPVASFVVLFLIWFRTDILAVVISFSVVLPNVYLNTLEGIKSTDAKLLEMAKVYDVHSIDRFFYIYRPALKPFWDSCMKLSIGMSWKSGVAAEVIGTPDFSIGEQLYMSKIYLDTAGVSAWSVVIICISLVCEKVFLRLWEQFMLWQPKCKGMQDRSRQNSYADNILLKLSDVSKAYDEEVVLEHVNGVFEKGQVYYYRTPSGSGKTTLFRLIADLEKADAGEILRMTPLAYAFQEDRLCESYSALKNLELVCGETSSARRFLMPLLDEEDLQKPCSQLSGGMKRRVAVARAFAAERSVVLLDEPFSGLDEQNRRKMQEYILKHGKDKAILIATHV